MMIPIDGYTVQVRRPTLLPETPLMTGGGAFRDGRSCGCACALANVMKASATIKVRFIIPPASGNIGAGLLYALGAGSGKVFQIRLCGAANNKTRFHEAGFLRVVSIKRLASLTCNQLVGT